MPSYELYHDDIETIAKDEKETQANIIQLMTDGMHKVKKDHQYPKDVRISHAKAHALLTGQLIVNEGLPTELAQGLFAKPGRYDVLVRMAAAPGEVLDDSKVNPTRGMAIKVLNVEGSMVPGYTGKVHDFVLAPGKEFIAPNAAAFLQAFKPNAQVAPGLSDTTKGVVSDISRVTNKALNAVGINSAKLDFFGHPKYQPQGEAQFSQTPLRYGDYVAKLGVYPDTPALKALEDKEIDLKSQDALREASIAFFRDNPAEYSVRVQLNTDYEAMPIEDATKEWSEDLSQYREVARLVLPAQTAWDPARDAYFDDLSFSPSHSLAAHRPLGSINRARMAAYPALATERLRENGDQEIVPSDVSEVPA